MRTTDKPNLEARAYGNIRVLGPNGEFMFYSSLNKLAFYIRKNLVNQLSKKEYQLNFTPKGLGYADRDIRFGNIDVPRENRCVVTGSEDLNVITKHHIVPRFIRQHFPVDEKSNFQFVVRIEVNKHAEYTREEQKFYDVIADSYGLPHWNDYQHKCKLTKLSSICRTLFMYGTKLPKAKKANLELYFLQETGLEADLVNLRLYFVDVLKQDNIIQTVDNNFGMAIASKITDYRAFERLWLKHFVDTTKPKYLPEDLQSILELEPSKVL